MGKGQIVSELGDGRYSVSLEFETARIEAGIIRLTASIAELTGLVDAAELELSTAQAAYIEIQDKDTLSGLLASRNKVNRLIIAKMSAEKDLERLQAATQTASVEAWCADLTEELSETVGTIEVPGERGRVQIQPGYEGNAAYSATRDGQLQPAVAGTPANVFRNWAMLPGWQKWKPTYRYGVITDIDTGEDTCSLTIDDTESSQQHLDINQSKALSDVSIEYMSCNSAAFEVGDHVLIKFEGQNWDAPKVIGFYSDPKPCGYTMKVKINGADPQNLFNLRLFHPDHGYGTTEDIPPTVPGTYEITGDMEIPGGDFENCFVEISCKSDVSNNWFNQQYIPVPLHTDSLSDVLSAENLLVYDYMSVNASVQFEGQMEDLLETERRHVWVYNLGFEIAINYITIPTGNTVHFYWDGTKWGTPGVEEGMVAAQRVPEQFLSGYPVPRDYLRFTGIDGPGTWYAPLRWMRCPKKISDMAIDGEGVPTAEFIVWNVEAFGNIAYWLDKDVLCACDGTIKVDDPVTRYASDPGASNKIPGPDIIYSPGTSETGSCTDDIGYMFESHVIYLASTTAASGSEALVADMFGTEEPEYTDFEVWFSAFSQFNQVFDEWWAGDRTYCEINSTLEFAFNEYSKQLLPEGQF